MKSDLDKAIEELHGDDTPSETVTTATDDRPNMDVVMSIPVDVQVALGRVTMPVAKVMQLSRGSVITLDTRLGDPVDIVVNGRVIARGEVTILKDDPARFGVSLTEIINK